MKIFKFLWHDENGLPVFKELEGTDDGENFSGELLTQSFDNAQSGLLHENFSASKMLSSESI